MQLQTHNSSISSFGKKPKSIVTFGRWTQFMHQPQFLNTGVHFLLEEKKSWN
jgi:hypothetical protein